MKKSINFLISLSLLTTIALTSSQVFAKNGGMIGKTGNASDGRTCNFCHELPLGTNPRIEPQVTLEGPRSVVSNTTSSYRFILKGGQNNLGGLNIAVDKGELVVTDSGTSLRALFPNDPNSAKEITHDYAVKVGADGTTISWTFDWTAPATEGTATIFGAGLSADGEGTVLGDMSASIAETITVTAAPPEPTPPVAMISAPKSAAMGETVNFNGQNSFDKDGSISSYSWNIVGLSTDTTSTLSYAFASAGVYTVELTVIDNDDKTDKTFVDITIVDIANGENLIPTAKISMPASASTGTEVTFDAANSISNSASTTYYIWDFGDGSNLELTQSPTTSVKHVFSSDTNYTVTLAVQNGSLTGITSSQITISTSTTVVVRTGETVYKAECESCHGVGGVGKTGAAGAKKIIGATALLIEDAIATTVPTMSNIALQTGDVKLLTGFLSVSAGTTGDSIYRTKCELCHGVAGAGGSAKNIENATQQMILNAVSQNSTPAIPIMQGIVLSSADATLIETLLNTVVGPIETGQTLYDKQCKICHGAAGIGGSAKVIVNASLNMVDTAITTITAMNSIPAITALTPSQRQKIVDYLKTGVVVPGDSVKGEITYIAKCQMCHGTGTGGMAIGILNASVTMIENAIINIPQMQAIVLDPVNNEKQNLVAMLAKGPLTKPTKGVDLFMMYCSYCHGADGFGGAFKNAPIKGMGITAQLIIDAYTGAEPEMTASNLKNVGLTLSDRQAIATWLK